MLMRVLFPAGVLVWTANLAAAEYFQLRAAAGGCLGRRVTRDALYLKGCSFDDPNVMWRWDEFNRLHSKAADNECVQAGETPQILGGVAALDRGTNMYAKLCNNGAARIRFQSFSDDWEFAGLMGDMYLDARPDLCMTHFGAEPVVGLSDIILIPCDELGGDRGMGWTAVFPEYNFFTLQAFKGGCIARRRDAERDELYLKACSPQDETIQWRLDDMSRLRSKVDESQCLQAEELPAILQGPSVLEFGSQVYVKSCGGLLKNQFQVINTAIPMPLTLEGPQGPLSLVSRPDLCIVHFGADPVIGESRIMMAECDALGGSRARGWIAVAPCDHPPGCPQACTLDVFTCPDGTTVGRDPLNDCQFYPCPACTLDVFICPDGTAVGRDPANQCDFFPCPTACTLDILICPDGTELNREPPECEFPPCPPLVCTQDVFECPDGTFVGRDPFNNCEFFPCPPQFCTQDVFECPDGSFVGRDPKDDCNFFPCPPVACTLDILICPDGTELVRDPDNDCEFPPCPVVCTQDILVCPNGAELSRQPPDCEFPECPAICPQDVFECPDGSFVGRDPFNNCQFFPCPAGCQKDIKVCDDGTELVRQPPLCLFPPCPPVACTLDILVCEDGTELSREPPNCDFPPCPPLVCTQDVFECPDGTFVGRDPFNGCEFFPCPPPFCTDDVFKCPDGSFVSRDRLNNCKFRPCPTPTECDDDVFFCPDGTTVGRVLPDCGFEPCPPVN